MLPPSHCSHWRLLIRFFLTSHSLRYRTVYGIFSRGITIHTDIYGVYAVLLAGKSPYIRSYSECRSYTVYTYSSGQPYMLMDDGTGHPMELQMQERQAASCNAKKQSTQNRTQPAQNQIQLAQNQTQPTQLKTQLSTQLNLSSISAQSQLNLSSISAQSQLKTQLNLSSKLSSISAQNSAN